MTGDVVIFAAAVGWLQTLLSSFLLRFAVFR